jgi:hypothetical protein
MAQKQSGGRRRRRFDGEYVRWAQLKGGKTKGPAGEWEGHKREKGMLIRASYFGEAREIG